MTSFSVGGYIEACTSPNYVNPYSRSSDEYWMFEALVESMKEVGRASPNPTVGCLFVKDGQVISKGATQDYGSLHGERYAASLVDRSELHSTTVYVTLEPCSHTGQQPPCAELLVELGVKRVVIAMMDPFDKVQGRGIKILEAAGIETSVGVLEKECYMWHLPFLMHLKKQEPLLIAKWAQSLDGCLADDYSRSKWITGSKSRAYTHYLRQKYDCIMVGSSTVLEDIPSLDVRDCFLKHNRNPLKIIFDPSGNLIQFDEIRVDALSKRTFHHDSRIIYVGPNESFNYLKSQFKVRSFHQIAWKKGDDLRHLFVLIANLYNDIEKKPLQTIMVEGGAKLHTVLLTENLYDIIHAFINPSIIGSQKNRISKIPYSSAYKIEDKNQYELLAVSKLENDVLVDSIKVT